MGSGLPGEHRAVIDGPSDPVRTTEIADGVRGPRGMNDEAVKLVSVDRGSAIIELRNGRYKVSGEWCPDDTWWVFAKMVYKQGADGKWELLDRAAQRVAVIDALRKVWPTEVGSLRLVVDEE